MKLTIPTSPERTSGGDGPRPAPFLQRRSSGSPPDPASATGPCFSTVFYFHIFRLETDSRRLDLIYIEIIFSITVLITPDLLFQTL